MSSRQAAQARTRTESTSRSSRSLPVTGSTPKFCILDCEDEINHEPRPAMKDSDLCAVCTHRIAEQARKGEAWVKHRKKQLGSWVGGFDHLPARKRGR